MLKKRENKNNTLKTNFTVFLYRPEKHESTVHFPALQHSYLKMYDLFRLSHSLKNKTLTAAGHVDDAGHTFFIGFQSY